MKGVKSRQSTTEDGDKLVQTVYAITRKKFFAVVKHKLSNGQHSTYAVVKLKKGGKIAKSQVKGLCDRPYNTQGEAKHAIRLWDFGWEGK